MTNRPNTRDALRMVTHLAIDAAIEQPEAESQVVIGAVLRLANSAGMPVPHDPEIQALIWAVFRSTKRLRENAKSTPKLEVVE